MSEPKAATPLSRTAASQAVQDIGWRFLLGALCASVPVDTLTQAGEVAAAAVAASGSRADDHLRVDMRPDRVELSLQTRALAAVTGRDTELARHITDALGKLGRRPASTTSAQSPRWPAPSRLVPADGRPAPAAEPDPLRHHGRARRG